MKRFLILITALSCGNVLLGQPNFAPSLRDFYNSPYWTKSLVGSFGFNSEIEPKPEQVDIDKIRELTALIQSEDPQMVNNALNQLITYANGQARPNPIILQLIGAISVSRMADAPNEEQRNRLRQQARTYFERAINADTGFPNFLRVHKQLGHLLFRMDEPDAAVRHFVRAIELGDREGVTFGILGAIYADQQKFVSAETALRTALMMAPDVVEFKQYLANVLFAQDRFQEAAAMAGEMLALRPDDSNLWLLQANAYVAVNNVDDAIKNLEIVRFMGKASASSMMLLGDVYMNKNMIEDAALAYYDAVGMDAGGQVGTYLRPAELLSGFGSYEDSMRLLDRIVNRFQAQLDTPSRIRIETLRAQNNIALGKGEEAAQNLRKIIDEDPLNGNALISLARYYANLDFSATNLPPEDQTRREREAQQNAINYFERAQSLDDPDVQVRAYVGEAQLRVQRSEFQLAENLLSNAQSVKPSDNIQAYLEQVRAANRARGARSR